MTFLNTVSVTYHNEALESRLDGGPCDRAILIDREVLKEATGDIAISSNRQATGPVACRFEEMAMSPVASFKTSLSIKIVQ